MNSKTSSDNEQYFSAEDHSKMTKSSDSFLSTISTRWKSITEKEYDEDLIEDEKIPNLDPNETSPEPKFKSFRDSTVHQSHWMQKISDDSFEALEQLVKSPIRDSERFSLLVDEKKGKNLSAIEEVNSDSSKAFESISENESNTETSAENYVTSSSQVSSNECNKQINQNISLSSLLDELDHEKDNSGENLHASKENYILSSSQSLSDECNKQINEKTPSSSLLNSLNHVKYGSGENSHSSNENYITSSSQVSSNECNKQINENLSLSSSLDSLDYGKNNSGENSQASKEIDLNESIKFNDTLEEMDFILSHGMNFKFKKTDSSFDKSEMENQTSIANDIVLKTPKANNTAKKTFFFEGSPYNKENDCKITKEKRNFFYSPLPGKSKNILSANHNYDNIMSPIKYFMENSPVIPQIKNVLPTKSIMEKHYPALDQTNVLDIRKKSTPTLPPKNYKCSTVTHVVNKDTPTKLPKNGQVSNMVDSLPKTITIKHEHPEKITSSFEKLPFAVKSGNLGDENDVNMSVHIKTAAVRTNTLK